MGRGLNLNLKLAMATKSIKPVSINEAVLNDLARYDNFVQFTPIIIKKIGRASRAIDNYCTPAII